jgi:spermidine/putrescine transport system substrate-binding protein
MDLASRRQALAQTALLSALSRRGVLRLGSGAIAGAFIAPLGMAGRAAAAAGELQIMAWEGYEPTEEVAAWRAANGISIESTPITNQDDVQNKFVGGNPPPIDLAEFNQAYNRLYVDTLKIVQPLDRARIPNYSADNLFGAFHDKETWFFDGQLWGAPYIWGMNTLIYNPAAMAEPKSYKDLLAPELKGKIAIMDDSVATWPVAARVAGLGARYPNVTPDELALVFETLVRYRDQARVIALNYGDLANLMASGEVVAALCADPSVITMAAQQGLELRLAIPEEGPVLWVDAWFVPVSSDNVEQAHALINEALSPAVQAGVAMRVNQAVVSRGAAALVDEANRARFDYDNIDRLFSTYGLPGIPAFEEDGTHATYDAWVTAWQEFRAGL